MHPPFHFFYGSSPWHYYLTQAIPILCGPCLPFVLHGAWLCARGDAGAKGRTVLWVVAWTTGVYSLAGHKEWRFLHPILPLLHLLAAKSVVDLYHKHLPSTSRTKPNTRLPIRKIHLTFLFLSVPIGIYAARFHAHAQISVLRYLRGLPEEELKSVGFLMPCHSTPGQAYLHRSMEEGRLWALGCEPPVGIPAQDLRAYRDQTDVFYASPIEYLTTRFPPVVDTTFPPSPFPRSLPGTPASAMEIPPWRHEWPSHLVFFDALLQHKGVEGLLKKIGYAEVWKAGNWLEEDWRRRGGVRVWRFIKEHK
ncbi:hypothetical protein EW146_g4163 [Bondarzewia mesenterica]|uniref:Mannosyltransferase n=1 Tax=Bondarzewia mesenterica TaxID=1095465 RepID=A0A4S4LVB7_9AGAM|nr:hypothetical protein EW146_g4163 [Bondarzewia mesenterica]